MSVLRSRSGGITEPPRRAERGCWEHCIAALVGCDPLDVPDLSRFYPKNGGEAGEWWDVMQAWLDDRGRTCAVVITSEPPRCPHIVTGPSPREDTDRHAVIHDGDELVYDIHSSGDGVGDGEISRYLVLDADELRDAAARARAGGRDG